MSKFDAVFKAKQETQAQEAPETTTEFQGPTKQPMQQAFPPSGAAQQSSVREPLSKTAAPETTPKPKQSKSKTPSLSLKQDTLLTVPSPIQQITRGPGRPNAKRSDPNFVQTTAYIRKQTHRDVKLALLASGDDTDFSELVEELLSSWLIQQK